MYKGQIRKSLWPTSSELGVRRDGREELAKFVFSKVSVALLIV